MPVGGGVVFCVSVDVCLGCAGGVGKRGSKRGGGGLTFVHVAKVRAEARDGIQHRRPVRPIQRLDGLSVQVLDGLLVAPAHAVLRARVAVERIYRLGDPHLRSRHGYKSR